MSRRIVTTQMQSGEAIVPPGGPVDRVVKYVPVDIVASWVAIAAALASRNTPVSTTVLWVVFAVLLAITPIWMLRQTQLPNKPPATTQAVVATVAFGAWVFALGGPFARYDFYDPVYGTVVLVLFSLVAALVVPKEEGAGAGAALG